MARRASIKPFKREVDISKTQSFSAPRGKLQPISELMSHDYARNSNPSTSDEEFRQLLALLQIEESKSVKETRQWLSQQQAKEDEKLIKKAGNKIIFAATHKELIMGEDPIIYAIENNIKIEGRKAHLYALRSNLKINGKDSITYLIETGRKIIGVEPAVYALVNRLEIDGQSPRQFADAYVKASGEGEVKDLFGGMHLFSQMINHGIIIDNKSPMQLAFSSQALETIVRSPQFIADVDQGKVNAFSEFSRHYAILNEELNQKHISAKDKENIRSQMDRLEAAHKDLHEAVHGREAVYLDETSA